MRLHNLRETISKSTRRDKTVTGIVIGVASSKASVVLSGTNSAMYGIPITGDVPNIGDTVLIEWIATDKPVIRALTKSVNAELTYGGQPSLEAKVEDHPILDISFTDLKDVPPYFEDKSYLRSTDDGLEWFKGYHMVGAINQRRWDLSSDNIDIGAIPQYGLAAYNNPAQHNRATVIIWGPYFANEATITDAADWIEYRIMGHLKLAQFLTIDLEDSLSGYYGPGEISLSEYPPELEGDPEFDPGAYIEIKGTGTFVFQDLRITQTLPDVFAYAVKANENAIVHFFNCYIEGGIWVDQDAKVYLHNCEVHSPNMPGVEVESSFGGHEPELFVYGGRIESLDGDAIFYGSSALLGRVERATLIGSDRSVGLHSLAGSEWLAAEFYDCDFASGVDHGFIPSISPRQFKTVMYTISGDVSVDTGTIKIPNTFGREVTFGLVKLVVNNAPTDADLVIDINLNGASIFPASNPTILDGETEGEFNSFHSSNYTWPVAELLTVDVDQIGSTNPGTDLVVSILIF